jgi:hypothetical protein
LTRPTYTDLILRFTPSASTNPSTTVINSLITNLFKQAFNAIHEDYSASNSIIDTDNVYSEIINCASDIVNAWNNSLNSNAPTPMPALKLSDEAKMNIIHYSRTSRGVMDNVDIYNSSLDDSIQ